MFLKSSRYGKFIIMPGDIDGNSCTGAGYGIRTEDFFRSEAVAAAGLPRMYGVIKWLLRCCVW